MTETHEATPVVEALEHREPGDIAVVGKALKDRIEIMDRIHTLLQQRIVPERDLKNIGGKFRRTINFARICRRVVGGDIVYRRDPKTDLPYRRADWKDDKGDYYTYTCSCQWRLPWGEVVEGLSLVSSRDPFFGLEDGDFKDPGEVNEAHIAQKSVTEAFKQAVFVGLGFPKDVTANELSKYGVDGGRASGHQFDSAKGNKGGSQATSQGSKDKRAEIEAACREMMAAGWKKPDGTLPASAEDVLQTVTSNVDKGWGGWRSFKSITEKSLPITHKQVMANADEFRKGQGGDGDPADTFD